MWKVVSFLLLYQEIIVCISGSSKLFLFVTQVLIQNLSAIISMQNLVTFFPSVFYSILPFCFFLTT